MLFTGDTLFLDGIGRPDLEDSKRVRDCAATRYDTLHEMLLKNPETTVVAPGHDQPAQIDGVGPYVDTLGEIRKRLPLDTVEESAFVDRVAEDLPPRPANHERIIEYNLGRGTVDQSARSLELRPNNCAISGDVA